MNTTEGADVTVWWTPDCGHIHCETNPVVVSLLQCPDGVQPEPSDD